MSSMMGGGAPDQEDMFAKLEGMRAVIQEVNAQFTDPVRPINFTPSLPPSPRSPGCSACRNIQISLVPR